MSRANQPQYIGDRGALETVEDIFKGEELKDSWWMYLQPYMHIPEVRSALAKLAGIQKEPVNRDERERGVTYNTRMFLDLTQGQMGEQAHSLLQETVELNDIHESDRARAAHFLIIHSTHVY